MIRGRMTAQSTSFTLPDDARVADAQDALAGLAEEAGEDRFTRVWYDSFDWRLYAADSQLVRESQGGNERLSWLGLETGESLGRLPGVTPPRFAQDLPDCPTVRRLSAILETRALLPRLEMSGHRRKYRVRDDAGKTLLRIDLETGRLRDPGTGRASAEIRRIGLLPVKGYAMAFERVSRSIADRLGLQPDAAPALTTALAAVGRRPMDYIAKPKLVFAPHMSASEAARIIHLSLIDTMRRNESGILEDTDCEFLHDFRVALRRARSALAQIRGVFDAGLADWAKAEMKWLGDATTPLRDLDVFLLDLSELRRRLPADRQADLDPFEAHLQTRRQQALERSRNALRSNRYSDFIDRWQQALAIQPGGDSKPPNADRPVIELASARIRKLYRRVRADGMAITDASPPDALHALRKDAKKLRYMIEFFQSLYDRTDIAELIGELKRLQDVLGRYQDCEVQRQALAQCAEEMQAAGAVPASTFLALGQIAETAAQEEAALRAQYAATFHRFDSTAQRRRVKRLFGA